MHELAAWAAQGRLLEAFGTGTAVLVVAIDRIGDVVDEGSLRAIGEGDGAPNKAVNGVAQNATNGAAKKTVVNDILTEAQGGLGPVGQALWDRLLGVAEGRDQFEGWSVACE
jgi:branched-chain amino acid aminotransferase